MHFSTVAAALLFSGLLIGSVASSSPLASFVDLPSVVLVFGSTFALSAMAFGPQALGSALLHPVGLASSERVQSVWVFAGASALGSGMLGSLVGLVQMLQTLDDPTQIGAGVAVALLSALYGGGLGLGCLAVGLSNSEHQAAESRLGVALGAFLGVLLWSGAGLSAALLAFASLTVMATGL